MTVTERKATRANWRELVLRAMVSKNGAEALLDELRDPIESIVRPAVPVDDLLDVIAEINLKIWEVVYLERKVNCALKPCQIKSYLLMIAANRLRDILKLKPGEKQLDEDYDPAIECGGHSTRAHRIARQPILAEYEELLRSGKSLMQAHRAVAKARGITVEAAWSRWEYAAERFRKSEKNLQNKVAL